MKGRGGNWLWNWMALLYDEIYSRFLPYLKLHQEIINYLNTSPPDSRNILDAGCGTGLLSLELVRRGYSVVGIDLSPAMLSRARKKQKKENLEKVIFLEGDLNENSNLVKYSFQKIIFIHSLYLMPNPLDTLRNFCSQLSPGGEIIMCNPSRKLTPWDLLRALPPFLTDALKKDGLASFLCLLPIALGMGLLNLIIQKRKTKLYFCWNEREIEDLLRSCGLKLKWTRKGCVSESHLLVCAVKDAHA